MAIRMARNQLSTTSNRGLFGGQLVAGGWVDSASVRSIFSELTERKNSGTGGTMIGGRGNKRSRRKYTKPAVMTTRRRAGTALPFDSSLAHLCWQVGLSHELTAWVMGRALGEVKYEWSVLSGLPLDGEPDEQEVERITAEIRSGWSAETFLAAERSIRHDTSCHHKGKESCTSKNKLGIGKRREPSAGCWRSTVLPPSR